jgi:hypothetical protein
MELFKGYSKMLSKNYFDRDGNEIGEEEFQKKFVDIDYQRVGLFETLANGEKITVSTVWLGINQSFAPNELPIIFETMVFGGRNNGLSRRYATELEALVGHNEIVDIVQDTLY